MLNKNLKFLRFINNFSQGDMASRLNIAVASYNRKENGKQSFSLNEAKIIADLFNKSIEEIFFVSQLQNTQL